ncbi:MAG: helix-turn-helix domain-containing protein [Myxococcota bacterium]
MGRPKDFAVDPALEQAMLVFWRHGYRSTSVRDLCEVMGIGAGSFYGTFGSKAELFRRALGRYLRRVELGPPSAAALRRYFDRVIADRDPAGCLLVASAGERAALEPDAQALVTAGLAALEDFFFGCLGERPGARADAAWLAAAAIGLQTLHRAGTPRDRLALVAERTLEHLDISPATQ